MGHFIDPSQGVRAIEDVEVKWADHRTGDQQANWALGDRRTALVVVITGEFPLDFTSGSVTISRQGDYVMWPPAVNQSWTALSSSVVLTVRA